MKKFISKQSLAVVALLCSSTGFAATVTLTPSNAAPNVGDTFFIDVFGSGFPDVVGATLRLTFSSNVAVRTPVLTNGITVPAGSPFVGGSTTNCPTAYLSGNACNFSVLGPTVSPPPLPTGNFGGAPAFRIGFLALAAGPADIVLVDDQGDFSWTDATTFAAVPLSQSDYTQANVVVQGAVVPAPAAAWLLGTGVIALAGRRLRRQKAA